MTFKIHPDITQAETLPASFYRDPAIFQKLKEKVFEISWQWIGDQSIISGPENLHPFYFMEHFIDEPMLLSRQPDNTIKCLSNVCTHRGNILLQHPTKSNKITCGYHGRRFDWNGHFEWMPEFSEVQDFPRPCDHLTTFSFKDWYGQFFSAINPKLNVDSALSLMEHRIGFLPLEQFKRDDSRSKDYLVNTHWALYCDNYLEGFHIPFVHNDLNDTLDYGSYKTEIYDHLTLQIGYADSNEECFDLPIGHPDHGKHVAAYYYWMFPNMMFNFYPWGLSVNVVKPISKDRTRVSFISFVYDQSKIDLGAGSLLDKVEREDEFVVENVHRGLHSLAYKSGRFSPTRETGVHYFHRLLAEYIS